MYSPARRSLAGPTTASPGRPPTEAQRRRLRCPWRAAGAHGQLFGPGAESSCKAIVAMVNERNSLEPVQLSGPRRWPAAASVGRVGGGRRLRTPSDPSRPDRPCQSPARPGHFSGSEFQNYFDCNICEYNQEFDRFEINAFVKSVNKSNVTVVMMV